MANIHEQIKSMLHAGKFEPYIRHIRFPSFKNLAPGTRIDLSHPLTVLVGPNGTNKTSILRALQACPNYYNLGSYWFGTELDRIDPTTRSRYIYGYVAPSTGQIVEVIKTRIVRENPDYFEPSRPIFSDGMDRMPEMTGSADEARDRTKTRWTAVKKEVTYLDFRSELSAYDKYFFHVPNRREFALSGPARSAARLNDKKSTIRRVSSHLIESMRSGRKEHLWYGKNRIVVPSRDLTAEELQAVSRILGRKYSSIKVITHKYFGNVDGVTAVLQSQNLRYSEAFAGSGEFAVVMLVSQILSAPDNSLILLDEPEVSLHPGAQAQLMEFLLEQVKKRYHQLVISTHSPEMVRGLPWDAIKVFDADPVDGHVELVSQVAPPTEAFFRLGMEIQQSKTIYVEDDLAEKLVRRAIRPLGEAANKQVRIAKLPGGAGEILLRIVPIFATSNHSKCLVLLDGDQKPDSEIPISSEVADSQLEGVVKTILRGTPKLSVDGHAGVAAAGAKEQQLRQILRWSRENVDFLTADTPETLLGEALGNEEAKVKSYWVKQAGSSLGRATWESVSSSEILAEQERALAGVSDSHDAFEEIRSRVLRFLEK